MSATGVVHGIAGTGKTFAVEAHLERLRDDRAPATPNPAAGAEPETKPETQRTIPLSGAAPQVVTCTLAFPSKPTMRLVADELLQALTGTPAPRSRNRFYLTAALIAELSGPQRLIVVDEAQRLNSDCIELLRHLHDHPDTRFALLYVGGDGCWEVLSREPMLASRVYRRLPFKRLETAGGPALMRGYHPIYHGADAALLADIDAAYGHGMLRNWAVFTRTALALCAAHGLDHDTAEVADNAYAKLGGGLA